MSTTNTTESTGPPFSLDQISITTPCRMDWELMTGDDRTRFCDKCSKNVYNLSAMGESEAIELIQSKGDRICGRIFKRADGTVVTNTCPPAVPRRKRRFQFSIAGLVVLITASASLCAAAPWIGKHVQPLLDRLSEKNTPATTAPIPLMGDVVLMPPTSNAVTSIVPITGKVAPPKADRVSSEN